MIMLRGGKLAGKAARILWIFPTASSSVQAMSLFLALSKARAINPMTLKRSVVFMLFMEGVQQMEVG